MSGKMAMLKYLFGVMILAGLSSSQESGFFFKDNKAYYKECSSRKCDTIFVTNLENLDKAHNLDYHWDYPETAAINILKVTRNIGTPTNDSQYSIGGVELIGNDGKVLYSGKKGLGGRAIKPLQKDWGVLYSCYEGYINSISIISIDKKPVRFAFGPEIKHTYGGTLEYLEDHYVIHWRNSFASEPRGDQLFELHVFRSGKLVLYKNDELIDHKDHLTIR